MMIEENVCRLTIGERRKKRLEAQRDEGSQGQGYYTRDGSVTVYSVVPKREKLLVPARR